MSKRIYLCANCKYWSRERNFGKLINFCSSRGVEVFMKTLKMRCGNHTPTEPEVKP